MRKEVDIIKGFLGGPYLKYISLSIPKIYKFKNWLIENNIDFDYEDQYGYSDKLEFDFVYFENEESINVFIKKEDERKFLEFLSIF